MLLAICSLVCKGENEKCDIAIVHVLLLALAIGNLEALLISVFKNTLFFIKTPTKTYYHNNVNLGRIHLKCLNCCS
jgi:riboflavin transporter FmnP